MKIIRLKPGERAPDESDRIVINALPTGRYGASGITATRERRPAAVCMVTENSLASDGEAEAAGIRWAAQHPIEVLYVERPA
ncbi:MAG: hypothetical protein QOG72_1683 [Sphingomonadales bacterium]|nr:hypothetical protein [Sphingomonadales bacterium]